MEKTNTACLDCEIYKCRNPQVKDPWPPKCPRRNYPQILKQTIERNCRNSYVRKVNFACEEVMSRGYDPGDNVYSWPRVRELIEYVRILGYKKIGIAACNGLISESKILGKILTNAGFQVTLVNCMAGNATRAKLGLQERRGASSPFVCNPLFQAEVLNKEKTDLNVMVGLCLGHDVLFIKNSKADVTPLIVKDRLTGHNPVVALYTHKTYYRNRFPKQGS
jgi:uncharacterized metal-binding protein